MWLDFKMNSDNNNNSNNNVKMKKWRFLAVLDILTGISTIVLNVVTLSTLSYDWVDWIGIGIWGGFFFISVGLLTIQRSPKLKSVVISTGSTTIILIALYAYNLVTLNLTYYCSYSFNSTTNSSTLNDESLCNWRQTTDIIFVVLGSLAFIINVILSAKAKLIMIIPLPVRQQPRVNNARPLVIVANTTFVLTDPRPYPSDQVIAYPKQHVYQTPVEYPTAQQQQPVNYAQENPPPYTERQ